MNEEMIQEHWNNNELPGIDCIIRADGTVTILNFYKTNQENRINYYLSPICDTTIESLEKYNDDIWTEIEVNPDAIVLSNGDTFVFGEGSMGNEGFIALVNSDKSILKWALFSTVSNPIIRVQSGEREIIAYSSDNLKLTIDIDNPERIKIEAC